MSGIKQLRLKYLDKASVVREGVFLVTLSAKWKLIRTISFLHLLIDDGLYPRAQLVTLKTKGVSRLATTGYMYVFDPP